MKILVLEPYYGGSHQHFLDNLVKFVDFEYTFLTLPARKWKMRMLLSAPWFVQSIKELPVEERFFDTVLCSTFVDVAVLRALVSQIDGWNTGVMYCTYFHENQFAYPDQEHVEASRQFAAINFTSALASDRLGFNSLYNKRTFLESCGQYLRSVSDIKLPNLVEELEKKSTLLYPGVDFSAIDRVLPAIKNEIPVIVWNHRWEHDKNPDEFFAALYLLKNAGLTFQLIILGQSFRTIPCCFEKARHDFAKEIIHFGYAESYEQYIDLLGRGDVIVSTSIHEFYGISVIEAVRAGCTPLLPKRLSYPELFDARYLYQEGTFATRLEALVRQGDYQITDERAVELTEKYDWRFLTDSYRKWLKAGEGVSFGTDKF